MQWSPGCVEQFWIHQHCWTPVRTIETFIYIGRRQKRCHPLDDVHPSVLHGAHLYHGFLHHGLLHPAPP